MNGAPVVVEVPIPNDDFEAFLEGMIACWYDRVIEKNGNDTTAFLGLFNFSSAGNFDSSRNK
jgi:hypothetical protein